ncbi:sigma 54-interacting transcriptional regulator [Myxococcota bacterium]
MTKPTGPPAATDVAIDPAQELAGAFSGCVLYVAEGGSDDRGRHLLLSRGSAVVGTAPDCDLQLHDSQVSRKHAEFTVEKQGIALRDLGSTNGTNYLGNRIGNALLKHGAHLRLGKTVLALLPLSQTDGIEPEESTQYGELIGASVAMRRLFTVLRQLETSDAPVIIQGETGTGKELVARTLHEKGSRRAKPFVVLDCGAMPQQLIDSKLFGHVRGAFTGAIGDRAGVFEEADGGTLFLDEIAELPIELQPRLLRVLETGQTQRIGSNTHCQVDVRVIAATHRDLKDAVKEGLFRGDLFFRLAVVSVLVPPLHERPEDIPLLARHLAVQLSGDSTEPLPDNVLNLMSGYDWPGNVRELRNVVYRLLSLGDLAGQLPESMDPDVDKGHGSVDTSIPYKEAREKVVGGFEAAYVGAILERHDGNISAAARSARIARKYFKELMRKHGLYDERDPSDDTE